MRQFALDRLDAAGELEQARERHLDAHLRLAENGETGLDQQMDHWREQLAAHHDDIATALRWALADPDAPAGRLHRGRQLAAAMARYWMLTGYTHDGLDFLTRASDLASPSDESPSAALLRSRLSSGTAIVAMVAGRRSLVIASAEQALADATLSGDLAAPARSRMLSAFPLFFTDFARCHDIAITAAADAAQAGDAFTRDWSRVTEGFCQQTRGHHDEALAVARAALGGAEPRGDRFTAAFALGVELFATMVGGRVDEAIELGRRSVEQAAPLGDYFAVGTNTVNAALPLALSGDLDTAHSLMDPVIIALESAPPADVVGFMVSFGYAALWGGDLDPALRWFRLGAASSTDGELDWTAGRCLPGLVKALRRLGHDDALARPNGPSRPSEPSIPRTSWPTPWTSSVTCSGRLTSAGLASIITTHWPSASGTESASVTRTASTLLPPSRLISQILSRLSGSWPHRPAHAKRCTTRPRAWTARSTSS